ncbi:MAG: ATP-binding protein [Ignavibacteria bacterium]|nr:ATP-binding protein [Ignavibacteria bacterium]
MIPKLKKKVQSQYPEKKILRVIHKLSKLSAKVFELDIFCQEIYSEINKLFHTDVFFISIADSKIATKNNEIVFIKTQIKVVSKKNIVALCKQFYNYSESSGKDFSITKDQLRELIKKSKISKQSTLPEECKGFVIKFKKRYLGIIGVINYTKLSILPKWSSELFMILASQLAVVIDRNKTRSAAEHLLETNKQFLANLSHEIRNPLNGIIGTMDLLSKTNLDHNQYNYVNNIKTSSYILLEILNNILDLSRIEKGKMKINKHVFDLELMIGKLITMFSPQAISKGLKFNYKIASDTPVIIIGDEVRILQILSNFLSNAIKFTDKGSISIEIAGKLVTRSTYEFKVKIKDTGIGISKADQPKLFEDFTQLDSSVIKSYHGTGLGLAISKELCKLINGKIGVTSNRGKGSTFWFTFFARKPSGKLNLRQLESNHEQFYFDNNPRILLVEDNKVNRKIVKEILLQMGCRVDIALNGQQAIDRVRSIDYDIILMDIKMPVMDGIEATKILKREKFKKCPPIVAITALSTPEDEMKFKRESFSGFISKPISSSNLGLILFKVLKIGKAKRSTETNYKDFSKIIDLSVINQLRKYCSEEVINETLSDFQIETKQFIRDIRLLIKKNDHNEILSKLHTLIGNSGTLGVLKIEQKAKFMEDDLRNNNINLFLSDFNDLKSAFLDFQKHLTKFIPKPLD